MKKIIALLMSLVMIFSFAACGGEKDDETDKADKDNVATEQHDDLDSEDEDKENETEDEGIKDEGQERPAVKPSKPSKPSGTDKPSKPSGNDRPAEQKQSAGKQLAVSFKNELAKDPSAGALKIAEAVSGNENIPYAILSQTVTPGLLTGFGNTEITGFRDGAVFSPMIGSVPFIGYVFILDEGSDISQFVKTLSANADRRWNICTEAEETTIETKGNAVFFVMCNRSFDE